MLFRKLNQDDFDLVVRISESHRSTQFNWTEEKIKDVLMKAEGVGAFDAHTMELQAFILFRKVGTEIYEIECLATNLKNMNKGAMKSLLGYLFQQLAENASDSEIEIWLEVHEKNQVALALYESLEFIQTGVRRGYYQDGAAAILCTKKIFKI